MNTKQSSEKDPTKALIARMEYDNLWALGPNCGVDKLDAIIKAAELCNYYGLTQQAPA